MMTVYYKIVSVGVNVMQDNELFKLCKEVYGLFPEWTSEDLKLIGVGSNVSGEVNIYPLYTSDYLLEKLEDVPVDYRIMDSPSIEIHFGGRKRKLAYKCRAYLGFDKDYEVYADTALKALLKLTIALHEAGELK